MLLRSDQQGLIALQTAVEDYFESRGRTAYRFKQSANEQWQWTYLHFLVDRRHVIRYGVGNDPHPGGDRWLAGVELAIGPDYFGPADFWCYAASERFRATADTDAVDHNLRLLDEFWQGQP